MLSGSEARLRILWKLKRGIHVPVYRLVNEDIMTKIVAGLSTIPKSLYVPDITSIGP